MGAKTAMLVYSTGNPKQQLQHYPALDRAATLALVRRLYPSARLEQLEDGDLGSAYPPDRVIMAGCFPGLTILADRELALERPSRLSASFIDAFRDGVLYLHAMHSVVDWFAYAFWHRGTLQRSLSVAPDNGIIEDIGPGLPFEAPYRAGEHPALDPEDDGEDYPLDFHPLELGEAALLALFGYQIEGMAEATQLEPERIALMCFRRGRRWWPFGRK